MTPIYKWTLEEDYRVFVPWIGECGREWGSIKDGWLTIRKGYSWNGCSPKFRIGPLMFGTWDGNMNPKTGKQWCYHASLVHDFLCQYKLGSRHMADRMFHSMLHGFSLQELYFIAVCTAGFFRGF